MNTPKSEILESLQFVVNEFFDNPIQDGALKGDLNPTLAVEKMIEIAELVHEWRKEQEG